MHAMVLDDQKTFALHDDGFVQDVSSFLGKSVEFSRLGSIQYEFVPEELSIFYKPFWKRNKLQIGFHSNYALSNSVYKINSSSRWWGFEVFKFCASQCKVNHHNPRKNKVKLRKIRDSSCLLKMNSCLQMKKK